MLVKARLGTIMTFTSVVHSIPCSIPFHTPCFTSNHLLQWQNLV